MPLALIAKITIDPQGILESRWIHNTAHVLLEARRAALEAVVWRRAAAAAPAPLPGESFRRWRRR